MGRLVTIITAAALRWRSVLVTLRPKAAQKAVGRTMAAGSAAAATAANILAGTVHRIRAAITRTREVAIATISIRGKGRIPYLLRGASRYVVSLPLAIAVAACAAVPPLDDAKLVEVTRASTDDMARYAKAVEVRSREEFGGASFSDGKGHVIAAFSASEYGAYQAYLRDHPDPVPSIHHELTPSWPVLRIAFQSSRVLFDPDASSMPTVVFRFCGSDENLPGFRMQQVMWHDGFITSVRAREIDSLIKTGARPQTYEVFFNYVYWDSKTYWDSKQERQRGAAVTLLPFPDDLCVAMHQWNFLLPSSVGRPLRISRKTVSAAAGPLPRLLPLSGEDPN